MHRRAFAGLAVVVLVSLSLAVASRERPATAAAAIEFGQPTITSVQGQGFEQDLRLDPTAANRFYTSVPGSLSSNTSWIWRTTDGGKTFKWVPDAKDTVGKVTTCAGGGDTELAVDPAGSLYFADLTLANFSTARSDDRGRNFTCSNTGVPDAVVDRQWYTTDGDPKAGGSIYLVNDEIGPGAPQCPVSGFANNVLVMYRSPLPGAEAAAGIEFAPAQKVTAPLSCEEGIMGNDEVSPVATKTGKLDATTHQPATLPTAVRHIYVVHDDASFSKISMGRCFPVAFGPPVPNVSDPSGLNCDDLPVTSFPGFKTGGNFPTMAIDKAGNLYVVWEQAPVDANGDIPAGADTVLKYSYSTNEGTTWHAPITLPTTGLHNNVMAWIAAGDDGRVGLAWYGTATEALAPEFDQLCGNGGATASGPDRTPGLWSLYYMQSLNAHAAAPTFTQPVLAGEHYIHKGTMNTVMGHQCGDRTLGDFLQMRVGPQGEAMIAYADSNNLIEIIPHGMFVRQIAGPGLYANQTVSGDPILLNSVTDPSGDGKLEVNSNVSDSFPNLDVLGSTFAKPAASACHPAGTACYRVTMKIKDLSLAPPPGLPGSDDVLVWLTQWLLPADPNCATDNPSCNNGGDNFFVYAESDAGGPMECYSGQANGQVLGGGLLLTYPGTTQITAPEACNIITGPNGSITIDVPISQVSLESPVQPLSSRLFSVTATTMTLKQRPDCCPDPLLQGVGGIPFNLIDVARAYDFDPSASAGAAVTTSGHAHTDYSGNGQAGSGDVHVLTSIADANTGDATPPTGTVSYEDLRANPPGSPTTAFRCLSMTATGVTKLAANSVRIDGNAACTGFTGAKKYELTLTDNGANPPNRDGYRMRLFNGSGTLVYDSGSSLTTVGLGNLTVSAT